MLITKGEIITSLTAGTILYFNDINPLYGFTAIPLIKAVKLGMKYQTRRNIVFSVIREVKQFVINRDFRGTVGFLIGLTGLNIYLHSKLPLSPYYYLLPLAVSYPLDMIRYCIYNNILINKMVEKCKYHFKDNARIVDNLNGILEIYSKIPLDSNNNKVLELVVNSTITSITQDLKRKNMFHVKHQRGLYNDFKHLEKLSIERITAVLKSFGDSNPLYVSTTENEVEIIHIFNTSILYSKLTRQLKNINQRIGAKKNQLSIICENGLCELHIAKDVKPIYILDNLIDTVKISDKMQLPFILGCDYATGKVIVKDLMEILHLLIVGKTGSGKSVEFKCIIETLLRFRQNIAWYMIDFAESALWRYKDFANVSYISPEPEPVRSCMNELMQEMRRRKDLFKNENVEDIKSYNEIYKHEPSKQLAYVILAIDEANGFKEEFEKDEFFPIQQDMKTLLKRGRKLGMLTIHAVQQANDTDYVKSWRTQMTRLCCLLEDEIDAKLMTPNKEYQSLIPTLERGEFYLIKNDGSNMTKYKGCLTDKTHDKLYKRLEVCYNDRINNKVVSLDKLEEKRHEQTATDNRN